MTRRFNEKHRTASRIAQEGKCALCGVVLEPGFHMDHITPYSRGGKTDIINGQALCPTCNLKKGDRAASSIQLREWQEAAIADFVSKGYPTNFVVSATPGAGKTVMSLSLAKKLLEEGVVSQIAVVVPTDSLRSQWADDAGKMGISLMPAEFAEDYFKDGYQGTVLTYHQLSKGVGSDIVRNATRIPTMAILDEVHHAGEGDKYAWGDALKYGLDHARHRLLLTGTPWRRDRGSRIPFVEYDPDDNKVVVDYPYEYGRAVLDGVCRRIEFHAYDGDARWHDCGEVYEASLGQDLADEDVSTVLDAAFDPKQNWIRVLLEQANNRLDIVRGEVPDAAGLVVAGSQWHAREYARILEGITGEPAEVAVSDDPEARAKIENFKTGTARWIVAVRMISEGVDIPRLVVGAYATKDRTPLIFRQIVGRFVRVRKNEEINAHLLMPNVPALTRFGLEIEQELRHQIEIEAKKQERETDTVSPQKLDLREILYSSEAVLDRTIMGGAELTPHEIARAEAQCLEFNLPTHWAANVAMMLRRFATDEHSSNQGAQNETPQYKREKLLRGQITTLVNKMASLKKVHPHEINRWIIQSGYPQRGEASMDELNATIGFLEWEIANHDE